MLRRLELLYEWEAGMSELTEIIPLTCVPRSLGPVSCVFTSCVSLRLTFGSGCRLMAARQRVFFISFLSSSGLTGLPLKVVAIPNDYDIIYLPIWQAIF